MFHVMETGLANTRGLFVPGGQKFVKATLPKSTTVAGCIPFAYSDIVVPFQRASTRSNDLQLGTRGVSYGRLPLFGMEI